jgi:EmrB/QacA subfamily drug resistance transporter
MQLTRHERATALIVASALFMQNLDGTVIATALPAMARDLHENTVRLSIAITTYLFAVALFVPASGWLADRFGARRIFITAIGVFTLGSVLCGLSSTLPGLVLARLVQGAGGALMVPVGRLLLLRTVPQQRLVEAMAWVTVPGLVGPVLGPPIGGMIATYADWRWIFFLNIPVGVLGIGLALYFVPSHREDHPGPLDAVGLLLCGLALASIMGVLELARDPSISRAVLAAAVAAGCLCSALYARHARGLLAAGGATRPALDFSLMRSPCFAVSVISGSLFRFGIGAVPFLLPLTLQLGFGRTAAQSGMITFATAVGAVLAKTGTQWSLRRFGFRTMLTVNALLCACLLALYAALRPAWPIAVIYLLLFVSGFFRSMQFTAYNTMAYADLPKQRLSAATTLYAVIQQVSLTVGIPISAAILHWSGQGNDTGLAAFSTAYLIMAALSLLAAPTALLLPRNAANVLAGRAA